MTCANSTAFRDPLLVLRPYPALTSPEAVARAVAVAAAVSPRVSAIACGIASKVPRSLFGDSLFGVSGVVAGESEKSGGDVERLLSTFSAEAVKAGLIRGDQVSGMRASEDLQGFLLAHARLHDLVIVPLPAPQSVSQFDARWYVEEIILGSGRPAIVFSGDRDSRISLERIVVAWDKSRAAARAIGDAMPILRKADRVIVMTVTGEKEIPPAHSGEDLFRRLELQGVRAEAREVDAAGRKIDEVLRYEVEATGSDLIVMGAYGRSRIGEFIWGGATKAMMSDSPVALFMSH